MNELFEKNWLSAILLEVIFIYSFRIGESLAMGLELHQVKVLPKVDEELFDKNWVSAILLEIIRIYSF